MDAAGVAMTLTALRWQFPVGDSDTWLIVNGHVDLGDREWSFSDPCLEMEEARELATWLQDAGEGRIAARPDHDDEQPEPSLSFLEPALGFSVAGYDEDGLDLRVFFTAEAAPPWLRKHDPHRARHLVAVRVRRDRMLAAAANWRRELNDLPARPWVEPS